MKEKVMHEINQRNVTIHCPTQEEADKLYELLGKVIIADRWKVYRNETCFFYYDGTYGNIAWAKENNYRTIYNEDSSCTIKVESKDYTKYPYMDTFKYYSLEKGLLYSNEDDVERPYYQLEDTGGRFSFYEKR